MIALGWFLGLSVMILAGGVLQKICDLDDGDAWSLGVIVSTLGLVLIFVVGLFQEHWR